MIKLVYLARLREQLDRATETLELTPDIGDVAALTDVLCRRGGPWQEVLGGGQTFLSAVNGEVAGSQTPIKDGDEVAFFPPVTGG